MTLFCNIIKVSCCCYSGDGSFIVSGSGDSSLRVWESHSGRCISTFKAHRNKV